MSKLAHIWHKLIASTHPLISRSYLLWLSFICRKFVRGRFATQIRNSVNSVSWEELELPPMQVRVGNDSYIKLHPYVGDFEGDALFIENISYEQPVFSWLEDQCADRYDMVIEIGANIGIYTIFFGKLQGKRLTKVIAFEPSPVAYSRLQDNLRANALSGSLAFPFAVADVAGWTPFYEPHGHLFNGSLHHEFANYFSETVTENLVLAVDAYFLNNLVKNGEKVLMKIDVEGYEPKLLRGLEKFLERHQPDIIIEVLKETESDLKEWLIGQPYRAKNFTDNGLIGSPFCANDNYTDWFFEYNQNGGEVQH